MIRSAVVASFFALAITAQGQQRSTEEGSGWYGIMFTSVGAFPAFQGSGRGDARAQLAVLGSTWKYPSSDVSQNSVGLAFRPRSTETIRYDLTVGWSRPSGSSSSDEATLIGGASAIGPLWWSAANESSALGLDWRLSLGGGRSNANGGYEYWSVVGQVPLRWTLQSGGSMLSAFASAGYGVAGVGDYADAEFGMRPIVAFGGSWASRGGMGLQVGAHQVMQEIEGLSPPWVVGASLFFPIGGKK